MTKYRVSEFDNNVGTGMINPRFFDTPEQVALEMLAHQLHVAEIDAANKALPPGSRLSATSLEIMAIRFGRRRRLNGDEERAVINCFNELATAKAPILN